MTIKDYNSRKTPEYYDSMFLDGYTPEEILSARRKEMRDSLLGEDEETEIIFRGEIRK